MELVSSILIFLGLIFLAITGIGLLRLPDFYTRVHAVSKTETLGITLIIVGLLFLDASILLRLKLLLIIIFITIANPLAAHLLIRAATRSGLMPWIQETGKERK